MPVLDSETIISIASGISLDTIAPLVESGECVLFLGSGVHAPSVKYNYPESECPPLGGKFSAQLAESCGFRDRFPKDSPGNLQRVSLFYEVEHNRKALVEQIKNAVHTGKKPSPALRALARLPFKRVITTNYDQLFERALRSAGKDPRVGIYSPQENTAADDYHYPTLQEPFVFKLHGDILKPESIVITDEDYIQFVLRMCEKEAAHPVPMSLRYNFTCQPTIFVGYSLLDYNLRLLFKTLRWRFDKATIPQTYSVDPFPDPLIFDIWYNQNKYVTFIARDVWTFVPELYRRVTGEEMSS